MAKRLISQKGSFNRKKLDVEFEKHQDMVKKVQKMGSPKLEKLPALSSPKAKEDSSKLKKKKNNRNKLKSEGAEQAIKEATERLEQEKEVDVAKGSSETDATKTTSSVQLKDTKTEELHENGSSKGAIDTQKDDATLAPKTEVDANKGENNSVNEVKNKNETQNSARNNNDSKAQNKSAEKLNEKPDTKREENQSRAEEQQKTINVQDEKRATPAVENTGNKEEKAQQPVEEKTN